MSSKVTRRAAVAVAGAAMALAPGATAHAQGSGEVDWFSWRPWGFQAAQDQYARTGCTVAETGWYIDSRGTWTSYLHADTDACR
ncbi:hypothetical protein [Allostreptomyces psammosilenae]|uniref:Uncharacterized protein n=1 Tax=Allostreptomyces psammosilenae TaxID=1892865 RepID=A0A853A8A2_9ACTN|nr:hypothetical protein [Allostreptomyces psammosilenae]NYI06662.1 hypothetical protein [Allostreptomyces psammosilenae]